MRFVRLYEQFAGAGPPQAALRAAPLPVVSNGGIVRQAHILALSHPLRLCSLPGGGRCCTSLCAPPAR